MKYSICIDSIFNKTAFTQAVKAVKKAGFDTIEFWSWWDKDITTIENIKDNLDINIHTFCTPFISLIDPTKRNLYLDKLKESIETAEKLDCHMLITQVGNEITGKSKEEQIYNIIKGLDECSPFLKASGITLVFEPLNTLVDHPGYFLTSSEDAFQIANAVNSPYVKVLFDIYHQLVTGEDPISQIIPNIDMIGHFHAAGYPGRNELDSGIFNYADLFAEIDATTYEGFIGIEYFPKENPVLGLQKLPVQS